MVRLAEAVRFETRGVLAGAYRGKDIAERTLLTHAVGLDAEGREILVACRRVKPERLTDTYAHTEKELAEPPTCPVCLERLRNLKGAT